VLPMSPVHVLPISPVYTLDPQPGPDAASADGLLPVEDRADPLGQELVTAHRPQRDAGRALSSSGAARPRDAQCPTQEAERDALCPQPVDLRPRWRISASVVFRSAFSRVSWPTLRSSSRTWRSRRTNSWAWLSPCVRASSPASPPRSSSRIMAALRVGVQRFTVRVDAGLWHLLVESPQFVTVTVSSSSSPALKQRWAQLIKKVYEADPLICPRCGGGMRIIALIDQPEVIEKILTHLELWPYAPMPLPAAPWPS